MSEYWTIEEVRERRDALQRGLDHGNLNECRRESDLDQLRELNARLGDV